MRASIFLNETSFLYSSSSFPSQKKKLPQQSFTLPLASLREKPNRRQKLHGLTVGCAKVTELAREMEAEFNPEGEDWIMELGTLRERCKERKGVVELLECLEREAIMGEDEGRDPSDYNRRAQIFDKSSRVFQALKERTTPHSSHQS